MKITGGQVAVITGGASGIGLALAQALAAEGCTIAIADVEGGAIQAALDTLPPGSLGVHTDVSICADVEHLAARVIERFGHVDILCNNAGVSTFNTVEHQTLDDWRWVLGVNLWGVIHGVHVFAPIMRAQGTPGHIVNTASVAGLLSGIPYLGPYAVSKVGVVSVSETLAAELASDGGQVGVSVLCPSGVNTAIMEAERNRPGAIAAEQRTAEGEQMRVGIRTGFTGPTGKEPEEIARLVLDAISRDRFWVITHGDLRSTIEQRFAGILAATPAD